MFREKVLKIGSSNNNAPVWSLIEGMLLPGMIINETNVFCQNVSRGGKYG